MCLASAVLSSLIYAIVKGIIFYDSENFNFTYKEMLTVMITVFISSSAVYVEAQKEIIDNFK